MKTDTRLQEILRKLEGIERDLDNPSTFLSIEGIHYGYFLRDKTVDVMLREILLTGLKRKIASLKAILQNERNEIKT